jgi:hypothetical protein
MLRIGQTMLVVERKVVDSLAIRNRTWKSDTLARTPFRMHKHKTVTP